MTKYERVVAAIEGREVDRIPCSFSLHFPHDKAFGAAGVKAHLDFFKESDTDIIKIMNENLVPHIGEGKIKTPADYSASVPECSMKCSYMQEQIDFTKKILDQAEPDTFSVGTLHGICASGLHPIEKSGIPYDDARALQVALLREDSRTMLSAFQKIADGMSELSQSYIKAGVNAVYYAALGAEYRYFTDEEFSKWIMPFDKQIMKAIKDAGGYCFLHMCKDGLNMERYRSYAELADVVNWGVFEVPFSIDEGKKLFPGKTILGGLPNRHGVLVDGTDEEIRSTVKDVIAKYGRKNLIVGADCTLATEQDMHRLQVAVAACRE